MMKLKWNEPRLLGEQVIGTSTYLYSLDFDGNPDKFNNPLC